MSPTSKFCDQCSLIVTNFKSLTPGCHQQHCSRLWLRQTSAQLCLALAAKFMIHKIHITITQCQIGGNIFLESGCNDWNDFKSFKSLFSIFCHFLLVETQMAEEMFSCLSIAEDQTQSTGLVYGYEKIFGNKIFNKQMIYYENLFYNINSQRIIWPINVFRYYKWSHKQWKICNGPY